MGDDIQAIKAGIMEIGDVFVINKADRDGVLRTEKELEALLSLAMRSDFWMPSIVKTVATENTGIEALAAAIQSYKEYLEKNQAGQQRREEIARWRILELLTERLLAQTLSGKSASQLLERLSVDVASKNRDPYSAVDEILASVQGSEE
jgi:LAO/AO transport system kinase